MSFDGKDVYHTLQNNILFLTFSIYTGRELGVRQVDS